VFELREPLSWKTRWIIGGCSVAIFVGLWFLITYTGLVPPKTIPTPADLVRAIPEMHYDHYMVANALVSLLRITLGFLAASVVAVPLGVLMGAFTPVRSFFQPITGPLRFLPIAAVVPIFIAWFGFGEVMKIAVLAMGTFVYMLPLIVETVAQVDDVYLQTAETLGASRWQIVRTILVPASLPAIFESMRVMFGIGWTYVMLAEFVSEASTGFGYPGIGFLINELRRWGELSHVIVAVIFILLIGVAVDTFLGWVSEQLFPWASPSAEG